MKKTRGIINRFENDFAIVEAGSENISIPRNIIPKDLKEGDMLNITISSEREDVQNTEKLARGILNEVLKEE